MKKNILVLLCLILLSACTATGGGWQDDGEKMLHYEYKVWEVTQTFTPTITPTATPPHTQTPQPTYTPYPTQTPYPTYTPVPTWTPNAPTVACNFFVDPHGDDANAGTEAQPWETMQHAFSSLIAGDTLCMRGGIYTTHYNSGVLSESGTKEQPITITNYPGEQVQIQINRPNYPADIGWSAFTCRTTANDPNDYIDFVRVIGTKVESKLLSNGVESDYGIIVRGMMGEDVAQASGFWIVSNCNHWEIAGIDMLDVGYGIFSKKKTYQTIYDYSPDNLYIHDNRVRVFYSEVGIQLNGSYNVVENNQVHKVTDIKVTNYGCAMINLLGHHNHVTGNDLQSAGSPLSCLGVMFEWDISDYSLIENNRIDVTGWGYKGSVVFAGGDNNIVRNNTITGTAEEWYYIYSDANCSYGGWPCNELTHARSILPANDPAAPDYEYFYDPRNGLTTGNQVYDNVYVRVE